MFIYLLKRVSLGLVIVVFAVTLLFCMIHLVPGDPARILLGPRATPEMIAHLSAQMGLDQPMAMQILKFFGNLLRGDLGMDVITNRPVAEIVFGQLPYTLWLIGSAIVGAMLIGIPLGCYSALHRNTWFDRFSGIISVACITAPAFVVALYSLLIFAVWLKWFPAVGAGEPGDFFDQISHLVLPAIAIGISWVGYLSRLVRASMLEVMGENHIRTARAYGLPENTVVYQYALKLAVLPTVTVIGVGMGFLLSAALFTEIVFSRPGIGKLIFDSITTRNYPVVMGSVLVSTIIFVISTAVSDLINAWLDPRIRNSL
ncbi:MAG: ABC transporter permease [Gammaproteobacteria bacterium]|nr:ABC transporter permease [Gammaproteobacteria bacterium]MDP6968429.1 ABC transporter permease [Gammaproteobacteria bacterium]